MPRRPNVLIFFTDDQRHDTIAALGNRQIRTPHLDALTASGTVFTHMHIPGGTSGAVCMPSRAMLHSGRTLFHIEGQGQGIPESHTTLGACFRQAGYRTFGTGKWHNGPASYGRSFDDGDEIFFGGMDDHWNVPACRFDPTGRYDAVHPVTPDPLRTNRTAQRRCDHITPGRHSTDLFTDSAVRFLEQHDGRQPFFLYVSLMAPHDPRTMPERFRTLYDPAAIDLPPNFAAEHAIDTGDLRGRDEMLAAFPREPAAIRRHIAEYYAMITHLDEALGRILGVLGTRGELEHTVVVVAGDNGLALGQHGLMGKQNLYDHSIRVPCILSGPGVAAGRRTAALAYLLDLFPTLCDLTGVPVPSSVEGRSLVPCLAGGGGRDDLFLAYVRTIRGLTDGRHKLIEYAGGETQLFDLRHDPWETKNLAMDASAAPLLSDMRRRLVARARSWEDRQPGFGESFWAMRSDLR